MRRFLRQARMCVGPKGRRRFLRGGAFFAMYTACTRGAHLYRAANPPEFHARAPHRIPSRVKLLPHRAPRSALAYRLAYRLVFWGDGRVRSDQRFAIQPSGAARLPPSPGMARVALHLSRRYVQHPAREEAPPSARRRSRHRGRDAPPASAGARSRHAHAARGAAAILAAPRARRPAGAVGACGSLPAFIPDLIRG